MNLLLECCSQKQYTNSMTHLHSYALSSEDAAVDSGLSNS